MSTAVSIVRTLLGLLFDHTIGNIVRMIPIIRLPKLERGPVSRGFLALLLVILFFGLTSSCRNCTCFPFTCCYIFLYRTAPNALFTLFFATIA